jgi:hypothetical protein
MLRERTHESTSGEAGIGATLFEGGQLRPAWKQLLADVNSRISQLGRANYF